uniref:(northern house mosquito) hypothetical protein n=1 Tax=Culex pipiens TaxID=7175 RepID=A0A8D8C3F7_CULPI
MCIFLRAYRATEFNSDSYPKLNMTFGHVVPCRERWQIIVGRLFLRYHQRRQIVIFNGWFLIVVRSLEVLVICGQLEAGWFWFINILREQLFTKQFRHLSRIGVTSLQLA